jgi:hypothetical protein
MTAQYLRTHAHRMGKTWTPSGSQRGESGAASALPSPPALRHTPCRVSGREEKQEGAVKPRRSPLVVAGILMLSLSAAGEEAASHGTARVLDESLGFSVNKLGLQHVLDLHWTRRLTASRSPLLADAHVSAGLSHVITPSYTRLGAWVELAPLSIFEIRAGAEPAVYFGTFGSLMSFGSYADSFDDSTRDARKGEARWGTGSRFYLSPTLKMKLGPLVAASSADLEWWRSSAAGPLYYEPARDTLLKVGGDRVLNSSSVLLRQHDLGEKGKLSYGLAHSLTYVFDAPANRSQRIGVVVVRRFASRRFGLHAPRIGGQVSYYLSDPSRKGQLTAGLGLSIGLAR